MQTNHPELEQKIIDDKEIKAETEEALKEAIKEFKEQLSAVG
jgi:F0F1-type ATP synthase alpha subunit